MLHKDVFNRCGDLRESHERVTAVVFPLRVGAGQAGGVTDRVPAAVSEGQGGEELHGAAEEEAAPPRAQSASGRGAQPRYHADG